MTLGQGISIGPFSFTFIRLLVLVGIVRTIFRKERPKGGLNTLDKLLLLWAFLALASSIHFSSPTDALVFRLGLVYNTLGIYFLARTFFQSTDDVIHLIKITAFVLAPVALEMLYEQSTGKNLFAIFGGVNEAVTVRQGRLRAQGPFAHAILAGTVGAVCLPLMFGIIRKNRVTANIGLIACAVMVVASRSSGPVMSVLFSLFALLLWKWRHLTRRLRVAAVVFYLFLELVMNAPAYYLIARIDLTGGSTGWHRAELIHSAIEHIDEWWLGGTDYTRHWMPTGVSWSEDHCDITNHYIANGVTGGLPLMLSFILFLSLGFSYVGTMLRSREFKEKFFVWSLGAGLFGHAATSVSVSYFDQSFVFLYLNLAALSSLRQNTVANTSTETSIASSTDAPSTEETSLASC